MITDGLNILKDHIKKTYTSIEIYILTDSQYEPIKELWDNAISYKDFNIFVLN